MSRDPVSNSREALLKVLQESFGEYELQNNVYRFKAYDQKTIANQLGIDAASLNRLMNQYERKLPSTFEKYIRLAENYNKAKKYEELIQKGIVKEDGKRTKPKSESLLKRGWFVYLPLLLLSLVLNSFFLFDQKAGQVPYACILEGDGLDAFISLAGEVNVSELALQAVLLNQESKQKGDAMSRSDTLSIIRDAKNAVRVILKEKRQNLLFPEYILPDGRRVVDLLRQVSPMEPGHMFACSDSTLAFAQEPPDYATRYDRSIIRLRPYILSQEISAYRLEKLVKAAVQSVQDDQRMAIMELAEKKVSPGS